jgi:hypothetical protein
MGPFKVTPSKANFKASPSKTSMFSQRNNSVKLNPIYMNKVSREQFMLKKMGQEAPIKRKPFP